jgi:hypothetical protein
MTACAPHEIQRQIADLVFSEMRCSHSYYQIAEQPVVR